MTRPWARAVVAVATLGLACGWLAMAAARPATAADWGVASPGPQALVDGPADLAVLVEAEESEEVRAVAVRFLRDGWPFGERQVLSYRAGAPRAGRSEWGSRLNPNASWALGGQAMPNGVYDVQAQVKLLTSAGEQWTEWRGHPVTLQVPPPATALTVRKAASGRVEVGWRQIQLPDFMRYDVERSADGASWTVVASTARLEATRIVDAPPPGPWRYRTRIVRSDGQGGQLATASAPVRIDPPLTPAPGSGSRQPAAAAADQAPGATAPPRPHLPPTPSLMAPGPGAARPQAPALPPPQDSTYHRTLPYPSGTRRSDHPGEPGGSTISVVQSRLRDRQLLWPIAGGVLLMITAAGVGWQLRR